MADETPNPTDNQSGDNSQQTIAEMFDSTMGKRSNPVQVPVEKTEPVKPEIVTQVETPKASEPEPIKPLEIVKDEVVEEPNYKRELAEIKAENKRLRDVTESLIGTMPKTQPINIPQNQRDSLQIQRPNETKEEYRYRVSQELRQKLSNPDSSLDGTDAIEEVLEEYSRNTVPREIDAYLRKLAQSAEQSRLQEQEIQGRYKQIKDTYYALNPDLVGHENEVAQATQLVLNNATPQEQADYENNPVLGFPKVSDMARKLISVNQPVTQGVPKPATVASQNTRPVSTVKPKLDPLQQQIEDDFKRTIEFSR
jgi:hypothetical protein